jgi:hypothetical protein
MQPAALLISCVCYFFVFPFFLFTLYDFNAILSIFSMFTFVLDWKVKTTGTMRVRNLITDLSRESENIATLAS